MSFTFFTNERGHHDLYRDVFFPRYGTDGGGNENDRSYTASVYSGTSIKGDPNHGGGFYPNHTRMPKDYSRQCYMIEENRPMVIKDGGYRDKYSETNSYSVRGNVDPGMPPNADSRMQELVSESATKALNKLRGGRGLQFANSLLDGRKTLEMIAKPTIALARSYLAARAGQWGRIPGILGANGSPSRFLANSWLGYQYGWLPLMSDIHQGMGLLRDGFRSGVPLYWAVGNAGDTLHSSFDYDALNKGERTAEFHHKTGITYSVSNATTDLIDSAGLLNPLSIAWEAIPFSFVVDWFVPVGSVLSALTATAGLRFEGGYKVEQRNTSEVISVSNYAGDEHHRLEQPGYFKSVGYFMARRALGDFPRPSFYGNAHPFSSSHISNALALLRQLF